jgi:TatA/E family protein of Tat protein translocase
MGTTEIMVIAGVGLVMFGPARIPEFAKQCGRAVSLFKSGLREAIDEEPAAAPATNVPAKAPARRKAAR